MMKQKFYQVARYVLKINEDGEKYWHGVADGQTRFKPKEPLILNPEHYKKGHLIKSYVDTEQ